MADQLSPGADQGARLLQAGDVQGALAVLQQAATAEPYNARVHSLLGICYARLGNLDASIRSLQQAVAIKPDDAIMHYNLANALFQAQRTQESQAEAYRALQINPEHQNAKQLLARIGAAQPAAPQQPPIGGSPLGGVPLGSAPLGGYGAASPTGGYGTQPPMPLGGYGSQSSAPVEPPPPWAQPAPLWGAPPAAQPPPSPWGAPQTAAPPPYPGAGGMGQPQGMRYTPRAPVAPTYYPPSTGTRILRGIGWGVLYGQIWAMWRILFAVLFAGNDRFGGLGVVIEVIFWVVISAFFGGLTGLIIGAGNMDDSTGGGVGIGLGVIYCILRALLLQSAAFVISIFFFVAMGRFIGASVAKRVQASVR